MSSANWSAQIKKMLSCLFNVRYILVTSVLFKFLLSFYLNYRQFYYVTTKSTESLLSKPDFERFCSMNIDLLTLSNYPSCPRESIISIITLNFRTLIFKTALIDTFFSNLVVPLALYGSSLYASIFQTGFNYAKYLGFILFNLTHFILQYASSLPAIFYFNYLNQHRFTPVDDEDYISFRKQAFQLLEDYFINFVTELLLDLLLYLMFTFLPMHFVIPTWLVCRIAYLFYTEFIQEFNTLSSISLKNSNLLKYFAPLAEKMTFPVSAIYVIMPTAEPQSQLINAALTGLFGYYRMIIYASLFVFFSIDEIKGIVCHELGHWYYAHVNQTMIFSSFLGYFQYWLMYVYGNSLKRFQDFGFLDGLALTDVEKSKLQAGLSFYSISEFGHLFGTLGFFINLLNLHICRKQELQADAFSAHFDHGENLKEGLKKFAKLHKVDMDPFVASLMSSHPPLKDRLARIDAEIALLKKQKSLSSTLINNRHRSPRKQSKSSHTPPKFNTSPRYTRNARHGQK
jgi:Zn-dependent protease with chaperone function